MSRREGMSTQRHEEKSTPAPRGERVSELRLLFLSVFLSLGLSCVNWASQECCLFYLTSSLRSSDLTFLCSIFTGFSLPHLLATAILDSFSLFELPNIPPSKDGRPNSLGIGASRSFYFLLNWDGEGCWASPSC